jgi:ATP-dependent Lon protease
MLYGVNVICSHDPDSNPVVTENTPTVQNLLGSVEPELIGNSRMVTNYRGIRAGALVHADGGYLILNAYDVLSEPGSWRMLMRVLRTGSVEIVPSDLGWPLITQSLKPQAIDISVRVILIGSSRLFYQLDQVDQDFTNLFKALAEHGARIASRKGKITARFGRIADIVREASFLATKAGAALVGREHVEQTIIRNKYRASLPSTRFQELIHDGTIMVQTQGSVVGQINGLAVINAGQLSYGFPARITATIGAGQAGVLNIEGAAALSGNIHTKGFHILGGLLRHLLDSDHPLTFSASIAFEQSYGGIDGDSASGAEICCLISALTGVPIRQELAMTGAIDQHGHIQAIGAVNEKIEGFFDACKSIGLNDRQGIVIPWSNAGDLMLRVDVVAACAAGHFQIHAVKTVNEALEVLTGKEAGQPGSDGTYPEDFLLGLAQLKATEFWRKTMNRPERKQSDDTESQEQ